MAATSAALSSSHAVPSRTAPPKSTGAADFHPEIYSLISERNIDRRVDANSLNSSFSSDTTTPRFFPFSRLTGMVPPKTQPDPHHHAEDGRTSDDLQRVLLRVSNSAPARLIELGARLLLEIQTGIPDACDRLICSGADFLVLAATDHREPLLGATGQVPDTYERSSQRTANTLRSIVESEIFAFNRYVAEPGRCRVLRQLVPGVSHKRLRRMERVPRTQFSIRIGRICQ